jgi:hypothetical protein
MSYAGRDPWEPRSCRTCCKRNPCQGLLGVPVRALRGGTRIDKTSRQPRFLRPLRRCFGLEGWCEILLRELPGFGVQEKKTNCWPWSGTTIHMYRSAETRRRKCDCAAGDRAKLATDLPKLIFRNFARAQQHSDITARAGSSGYAPPRP